MVEVAMVEVAMTGVTMAEAAMVQVAMVEACYNSPSKLQWLKQAATVEASCNG